LVLSLLAFSSLTLVLSIACRLQDLRMRRVTWNRFPLKKNCWLILLRHICWDSLLERRYVRVWVIAEPIRTIPRKFPAILNLSNVGSEHSFFSPQLVCVRGVVDRHRCIIGKPEWSYPYTRSETGGNALNTVAFPFNLSGKVHAKCFEGRFGEIIGLHSPKFLGETLLKLCRRCLRLFCRPRESIRPDPSRKALGRFGRARCWQPSVTGCQVTVFLLRSLCLSRRH